MGLTSNIYGTPFPLFKAGSRKGKSKEYCERHTNDQLTPPPKKYPVHCDKNEKDYFICDMTESKRNIINKILEYKINLSSKQVKFLKMMSIETKISFVDAKRIERCIKRLNKKGIVIQ